MSPAMSAYWLSVNSLGPTLILIVLIVLWLNRRGIIAPPDPRGAARRWGRSGLGPRRATSLSRSAGHQAWPDERVTSLPRASA